MAVLFATTSPSMLSFAQDILKDRYGSIRFFQIPWTSDFADCGIVQEISQNGIEVVIARGAVSRRVRALGFPVSVVELPVSTMDLLKTLQRAAKHGRRIAAVASRSMLGGIENLGPSLGVDVTLYHLDDHVSPEALVRQAIEEGAEALVCSYLTWRIAQSLDVPAEILAVSPHVILEAAAEALHITERLAQERAKSLFSKKLLEYTPDALVAVDRACRIVAWNHEAERILGISFEQAQDREICQLYPELKLEETLATGRDEQGLVLKLNGLDVVCHKRIVLSEGLPVAAFAAFQEISRMQQIEERVRRKIYADGHTAACTFDDIEGTHPALRRAVSIAREFAVTDSSVLLLGETGVGKEIFAQSIHNFSRRSSGPFVAINCAALPGNLLESELFGYVGGAFTGANPKGKPGMFELAHKGTLLLDEMGEMDLMIQGKILRVLEERKVMRLGSERLIPVDVRVLAATNRNPLSLIAEQRFRQDLYYRLNVLRLTIPPLRERPEDIAYLAAYFLAQYAAKLNRSLRLSQEAIQVLQQHNWPGNVRELRNFMERTAVVHKSRTVDAGQVALSLSEEQSLSQIVLPAATPGLVRPQTPPQESDRDIAAIRHALDCCKGNASQAARLLGISRITLWRKLKRDQETAKIVP